MHRGRHSPPSRCATVPGSPHQDGSAVPGRQCDGRPRAPRRGGASQEIGAADHHRESDWSRWPDCRAGRQTGRAGWIHSFSEHQFDPRLQLEPVQKSPIRPGEGLRTDRRNDPMIMLVRKDFPADDVATFVKVAGQRTATKPLTYGSGNTAGHIAAELLKAATKVDMVHVPYRGSPQALQGLVGGHIDLLFGDPYTSMSLVNGGQLKVLG